MESHKHKLAKELLCKWLRNCAKGKVDEYVSFNILKWRVNRGAPDYGVWLEYPILKSDEGIVWDEKGLDNPQIKKLNLSEKELYENYPKSSQALIPTYEQVKEQVSYIADIAIQHKGSIIYLIEVIHRNHLKIDKINKIKLSDFDGIVLTIDADNILNQVNENGKNLKFHEINLTRF
jgi:hypothetical protein